jgi:hypothetical protein
MLKHAVNSKPTPKAGAATKDGAVTRILREAATVRSSILFPNPGNCQRFETTHSMPFCGSDHTSSPPRNI